MRSGRSLQRRFRSDTLSDTLSGTLSTPYPAPYRHPIGTLSTPIGTLSAPYRHRVSDAFLPLKQDVLQRVCAIEFHLQLSELPPKSYHVNSTHVSIVDLELLCFYYHVNSNAHGKNIINWSN